MLFRFGEKHGLSFALPADQAPHFSYPRYFEASSVEGFSGGLSGQFDIMCQHLRFQPVEVQRVMPRDTFYFTILRDPARLLESAFSYYKLVAPFARAWSVDHFLEHTGTFYSPLQPGSHYARNLMAFDLGFDPDAPPTRRHVARVVQAVAARFDLVLIAEHLDESLVLLRDALCWELDDVVAFPANQRAAWAREPLAPDTERRARAWNALDGALHAHFNRTLWARLRALGPARLRREVAALRRRRAQLARTCLPHGNAAVPGAVRDPELAPLSHGLAPIVGYELRPGLDAATERTCRSLATPELQFARRLYLRQFPERPWAGGGPPQDPEHNSELPPLRQPGRASGATPGPRDSHPRAPRDSHPSPCPR
ncbi:galactose-3-O-sulfotransferase 2-like [Dasypus novemcinctus]|uniref:galactose-3-O-sulfotransferase 2-like n=1 Tax=Dasypus novemcinctus TaxID=9361 RepID=UPI00265E12EF|nr:galactose-3-O-sulfotransferase 4-like [Dasypus novemcinctus]